MSNVTIISKGPSSVEELRQRHALIARQAVRRATEFMTKMFPNRQVCRDGKCQLPKRRQA